MKGVQNLENKADKYVVYRLEICRVGDIVKKCFDGINEKEYYTLFPVATKCTYYIPVDNLEGNIRPVMTKGQFIELLDKLPNIRNERISNKGDRKHIFSVAIKTGDYNCIIPLINEIYNEKNNSNKKRKQLYNEDRKYLELLSKFLQCEVAFSFGIGIDEAEDLIRNKVSGYDYI